jgi:hypothetical protein
MKMEASVDPQCRGPDWMPITPKTGSLFHAETHDAHPTVVDRLLVSEARWELMTPSQNSRGYVLSRLRWSDRSLGSHVSGRIADLVQADADMTDYAVREAIIVVLADGRRPSEAFLAKARERATVDSDRRALWIAVLLALDGNAGLKVLNEWVEDGPSVEERSRRMTAVLNELFNDDRSGIAVVHKDFVKVPVLVAMLAYPAMAPSDGEDEDGVAYYRASDSGPGKREQVLELLFNLPGRETYDALTDLAAKDKGRRDRLLVLAERRAEQDADLAPWSPGYVYQFARDVERPPRTEEDLFRVALSRLDDLKHEYEQGDESEASLLMKVSNEVELRKVIANRLKQAARSGYTTGSEEELADGKRTDIRIHHPAIENRIPIEIKIAGQWRAPVLKERLKNQLIGQYMRESNYGIFLLVNRGGSNDGRRWRIDGRLVGLSELEQWLRKQAKGFQRRSSSVADLEVMSIDLLKLGSAKRAARSDKAGAMKGSNRNAPGSRAKKKVARSSARKATKKRRKN